MALMIEVRKIRLKLMLASGGLCALLAVLYYFPPEQNWFYPRCLFHALTGLQCPGCGGLRAVHQLLHGNVSAAWHFNALLVLMLPIVIGIAGVFIARAALGRPLTPPFQSPIWLRILIILAVAFAIGRNLLN